MIIQNHPASKTIHPASYTYHHTVNDKSFEGENFLGLLGSSGMWGKVLRFFPSPCTFIHSWLSVYKTATSISMKASRFSSELSLKLSLAYSEMNESTLLTWVTVCADFTFSRMTMQSQEKIYSWSASCRDVGRKLLGGVPISSGRLHI